jgi:hypothetical protein
VGNFGSEMVPIVHSSGDGHGEKSFSVMSKLENNSS